MCFLLLGDLRDPRTWILGRHGVAPGDAGPPGTESSSGRSSRARAAYAKQEANQDYQTPSADRTCRGPGYWALRQPLTRAWRAPNPLLTGDRACEPCPAAIEIILSAMPDGRLQVSRNSASCHEYMSEF